MSDDRHTRRSHAAVVWPLALVALVVFYLLSVLPIACVLLRTGAWNPGSNVPPLWFDYYRAPGAWVIEHTPLKRPLEAYNDWVYQTLAPHITP